MYKSEILADSLSPQGDRLTTFKVTFPRIVLAEFNTHRMFSRNSASSRAIPFKKMVKMVEENPFIPIAWQKDHKGMQGTEYFTDSINIEGCNYEWLKARDKAYSKALAKPNSGRLSDIPKVQNEIIQSLLPKNEWDVEFDEQGKLKLVE
jgi:thymidylate synthase ThyX